MKLPKARISLLRILKPGEVLVIVGESSAVTCAARRAGVNIQQARRLLVDPVSGDSLECRLVALSDETPPEAAPTGPAEGDAAPTPIVMYRSEVEEVKP